jgi:hypothetical protein
MSATDAAPAMASYRDAVTELIEAGERFGDVEVVKQRRDTRAHLAALTWPPEFRPETATVDG